MIGFDFSVNIYSAVIYAQWYRVLLPKTEFYRRFTQHLCISWLLGLISLITKNSLISTAASRGKFCLINANAFWGSVNFWHKQRPSSPTISASVSGALIAPSRSKASSGCHPTPSYTSGHVAVRNTSLVNVPTVTLRVLFFFFQETISRCHYDLELPKILNIKNLSRNKNAKLRQL